MSFLAPLMLAGLLGVAIPIAIHLIGKRRARVVKFAALDFLLASKRRTARRLQLRERLLLLVRALACLALALALAKPFTTCNRPGPSVVRGPQAAVLVVDDSFASGYKREGRTLLAREVEEAERVLRQLGPEAEVAVVRASEGADESTELTRDHLRLRDRLNDLDPTAHPSDLGRALGRAAQLLAGSSHARKTVFVFSPMQATAMHDADPPWGADGPILDVVDVRGGAPLPNLAITRVRAEPDAGLSSRGIAVTAEIANFGLEPAKSLGVQLRLNDTIVARGTIDVPPGGRAEKRFLAALRPDQRAADASVEIDHDNLPADDRRDLRAELRDQIRVLLVDGDPRTTRYEDELFYVEAALRPGDRADAGIDMTTTTVDALASIDLGGFDVVVLANVPALAKERADALAAWVDAGGGLLVAPGDNYDAAAYGKTMRAILPGDPRDPVDVMYGAPPEERQTRTLHLEKWEADHPIFAPFPADAPELRDAGFTKIILLGPTPDGGDRKVLARFSNGATALVEASRGRGRLLLYCSTLDRDWNDLPIHPGFLPLVEESVKHLARKHERMDTGEILVGRSVVLPTLDLEKLEVRAPDGKSAVFEGERLEGRASVRFGGTDAPGIYRVIGTDKTGATRDRDELAFAIDLDPRGSDLTILPATKLPPSGHGGGSEPAESEHRVELWHAVAAVLLLLLVIESILLQR
ncbi:MAG TPA: BatA domain-containing protein [Kofleriaceae bacterium]|nr:BatA domain-containing protein [Kofleriaceae bacterium]